MLQLSGEQLQAATAHLDQAVYNHEQWHKGLQRVLIARLPPDDVDLLPDAHLRCRFGQWYESDAAASLREQPAFAALGQAHQQMHESATHLLQRSADDLPIPVSDLDEFSNRLDRMRLEIESLRRELTETAQNRDRLTGARNRTNLLADLREQQALVRRGLQECALVMIDLDHFKEVNDRQGHAAGDAVLSSTASCLQSHVRAYDRLYRYGGEEFLVLMPEVTIDAAATMAERSRVAVDELQIEDPSGGPPIRVTASFGGAALDATRPVEESIDRADKALYQAKAGGRNRVEASA
jgi:diguanylate cyclase (GGDEF)-like protein